MRELCTASKVQSRNKLFPTGILKKLELNIPFSAAMGRFSDVMWPIGNTHPMFILPDWGPMVLVRLRINLVSIVWDC